MESQESDIRAIAIEIELDGNFFSNDAILKTCYWYSKHYAFQLKTLPDNTKIVVLDAKDGSRPPASLRADFISAVTDFVLRDCIESKTSEIRQILLAKAFAESGVLEDAPEGLPIDQVEQETPSSLFKILSHS